MPILDALSTCVLHNPATRSMNVDPGFKHRLNLCRAWGIDTDCGLRILDIGCGQGESSVVFAQLVGPRGHVAGIDPAPPTYGAPYTLQDSQAFILDSVLGDRITFVHGTAPDFLASQAWRVREDAGASDAQFDPPFDAAIFCHSLWYLPDRDAVSEQFAALAAAGVSRVYFAEYTLQAGSLDQELHELAARTQILFHRLKSPQQDLRNDDANVRGALEPTELLAIAQSVGWKVRDSGIISPPRDMRDGHWETQTVLSPLFRDRVVSESLAKEHEDKILTYVPRINETVDKLKNGGKSLAAMDVFWAVMDLDTSS